MLWGRGSGIGGRECSYLFRPDPEGQVKLHDVPKKEDPLRDRREGGIL